MARYRVLAAGVASVIAVATASAYAPARSLAQPGQVARSTVAGNRVAGQVVAYRGKGGSVFANRPGSSTFRSLGNTVEGAPAVAWANGQYFFVADTKHGIKIRTFTTKWAQLVKGGIGCSQPDLASDGHRLGLACLHHGALYAATFTAPHHGVPLLAALHLQGGKNLIHGAGAFYQAKQLTFELIGQVYEDDAANWNSHYAAYGKPPLGGGGLGGDDFFLCRAQATGSSAPRHGSVYLGCAVKHKTYYLLSVVNETGGVCPVRPTAHVARARVGIAPTGRNAAVAVYETPTGGIAETSMRIDSPAIDCGLDDNHDTVIANGATSGPSIALGANGYR